MASKTTPPFQERLKKYTDKAQRNFANQTWGILARLVK
jgi:hypothetical protein